MHNMFNPRFQRPKKAPLLGNAPSKPPLLGIAPGNQNIVQRQPNYRSYDNFTPKSSNNGYNSSTGILCRFFAQGRCKNLNCKFKHESPSSENEKKPPQQPPAKEIKEESKNVVTPSPTNEKQESQDKTTPEAKTEASENTNYCVECNIDCKTAKGYQNHIRGLLHTQKVMNSKKSEDKTESDSKPLQPDKKLPEKPSPQHRTDRPENMPQAPVIKHEYHSQTASYNTGANQPQSTSHNVGATVFNNESSMGDQGRMSSGIHPSRDNAQGYPMEAESDEFYCCVCRIDCKTSKAYQGHTRGLIHTQKMMELEKMQGRELVPEEDPDRPGEFLGPSEGLQKTSQGTYQSDNPEMDISHYVCEVCDCTMTGLASYVAHMEGSRHTKNLKNRALGARIKRGRANKVVLVATEGSVRGQSIIDECEQPLIGLQHVVEFVTDSVMIDPRYVCNLCEKKFDINSFVAHCTGAKHRLLYMKEHTMNLYSQVKHKNGPKSELTATLEELAMRIQREEGRFTLKQKVLDDATMLERNAKNLIEMTDIAKEGFSNKRPLIGAKVLPGEDAEGNPMNKRQKPDTNPAKSLLPTASAPRGGDRRQSQFPEDSSAKDRLDERRNHDRPDPAPTDRYGRYSSHLRDAGPDSSREMTSEGLRGDRDPYGVRRYGREADPYDQKDSPRDPYGRMDPRAPYPPSSRDPYDRRSEYADERYREEAYDRAYRQTYGDSHHPRSKDGYGYREEMERRSGVMSSSETGDSYSRALSRRMGYDPYRAGEAADRPDLDDYRSRYADTRYPERESLRQEYDDRYDRYGKLLQQIYAKEKTGASQTESNASNASGSTSQNQERAQTNSSVYPESSQYMDVSQRDARSQAIGQSYPSNVSNNPQMPNVTGVNPMPTNPMASNPLAATQGYGHAEGTMKATGPPMQGNHSQGNPGQYAGSQGDLRQYTVSQSDRGQHTGSQSDLGQYAGSQGDLGQYARGQSDLGQRPGGQSDLGQYAGGQSDLGQYTGSQSDLGQYAGGQSDLGQYAGGQSDLGQYAGGQSDLGQYAGGQSQQAEAPQGTNQSANNGSQVANMLNNLSQVLVNSEEDASMALQVSNALTQALIEYRIKHTPGGAMKQ